MKHVVYKVSLAAVPPTGVAPAVTPVTRRCVYTNTSVNCTGFGGRDPMTFVQGAAWGPPTAFSLIPTLLNQQGCAYTPSPVSLLAANRTAAAFEAQLTFSFNSNDLTASHRGFTFLLAARSGACGYRQ